MNLKPCPFCEEEILVNKPHSCEIEFYHLENDCLLSRKFLKQNEKYMKLLEFVHEVYSDEPEGNDYGAGELLKEIGELS